MNVQDNLFEKPLIDYITVAVEYCKTLESCQGQDRKDFCKMKKDQQIVFLRYSLKVFFLSGRTRTRIFVSIRTPQILAFSGTG
jgi:hypothetical protein